MKASQIRTVSEFNNELKLEGFKAYPIDDDANSTRIYSRKDFYKICLTTGKSKIHYADRSFEQKGTVLFFGNPNIPYSWETLSTTYVGYTILFSEDFFKISERSESLLQSPFFKIGGTPILDITTEQRINLNTIFQKIIDEQNGDYIYKAELVRNYINLIIHEAIKLQPSKDNNENKNAASRITTVFFELLERQFPIETPDFPLKLKTAKDFAQGLSVHVNHLNHAVKEITGRPTTSHIAERIITEAKALLKHTDWSIAEIGYALGFEYPTYFNNYFKRLTKTTPTAFRQ